MRGLLVPVEGEPSVVSRYDWQFRASRGAALGCTDVRTAALPTVFGRFVVMSTSADNLLEELPVNRAVTAMVGYQVRGPALFTGYDPETQQFAELSIIGIWRLGAQLVIAERKQLTRG